MRCDSASIDGDGAAITIISPSDTGSWPSTCGINDTAIDGDDSAIVIDCAANSSSSTTTLRCDMAAIDGDGSSIVGRIATDCCVQFDGIGIEYSRLSALPINGKGVVFVDSNTLGCGKGFAVGKDKFHVTVHCDAVVEGRVDIHHIPSAVQRCTVADVAQPVACPCGFLGAVIIDVVGWLDQSSCV